MDRESRERAGRAVANEIAERGWNSADLARHADIPDPATVREFIDGKRWPRGATRAKIEAALDWQTGHLDDIAKARASAPGADLVVAAIERSDLSRADKSELIWHYHRLLDASAPTAG